MGVESVHYELLKNRRVTTLRINDRGEFHLAGILIPFPTLLKAFAVPPEGAKRSDKGKLLVTVSEDGRVYTLFTQSGRGAANWREAHRRRFCKTPQANCSCCGSGGLSGAILGGRDRVQQLSRNE